MKGIKENSIFFKRGHILLHDQYQNNEFDRPFWLTNELNFLQFDTQIRQEFIHKLISCHYRPAPAQLSYFLLACSQNETKDRGSN